MGFMREILNAFQVDCISGEADVSVSLSHAEDRIYAGNVINGRIIYPTFAYLVRFSLYISFYKFAFLISMKEIVHSTDS
jgi:hypothetical protein